MSATSAPRMEKTFQDPRGAAALGRRAARRTLRTLLLVLALVIAVLVPLPAQAAGCFPAGGARIPEARPAAGDVIISGHGWGHGIGMSQWGAQGAATLGCGVDEILSTYYPGASLGRVDSPSAIRVGIVPNRPGGPLVSTYDVAVTAGSLPWSLQGDGSAPIETTQAAGTTWRVAVEPDGSFVVRDLAVPVPSTPGADDPGVRLRGGDGLSTLRARIGDPTTGRVVRLPRERHTYRRGTLEFFPRVPGAVADGMYVTLQVSGSGGASALDAYLYGLAEVPSSWRPAALQAQAIVGRSFAIAQQARYRGYRSDCRCDLFDSTSSQHYTAYDKEGEATYGVRWMAAVDATSGRVLRSGGDVAVGFYSSSSGGHTETNTFVWGGTALPYLKAVDDSRWELASGNRNTSWSVGFSVEEITADLAAVGIDVGSVRSLTAPPPRGASGRVGDPRRGAGGVLVQGSEGSVRISGDQLRWALGLRSTLVRITSPAVSCTVPSGVSTAALRPRRIAGENRIETAVALSEAHWASAPQVVLASAADFPDALAGGPLAAQLDAPLLLTAPNALPDEVAAELDRLGATQVSVLGGEAAVASAVEAALEDRGLAVERISGTDRWETAAQVAEQVGPSPDGEILLALGRHREAGRAWPDAVASGAVQAAGDPVPLLLTASSALPDATRRALTELRAEGAARVLLLGGSSAVPRAVEDEVARLGLEVRRIQGADRYGTSAAAVDAARARGSARQELLVATAAAFPDALAAAPVAARTSSPLLLVDPCDLVRRSASTDWFDRTPGIRSLTVVGGERAVSERVRWQLDGRLEG